MGGWSGLHCDVAPVSETSFADQCALIDLVWCPSSMACVQAESDCVPAVGLSAEDQCTLIDLVWCASSHACVHTISECVAAQEPVCPAVGANGCCTDTLECPPACQSRSPPAQPCGWEGCHLVCDCVCPPSVVDRSNYDGLFATGHGGRFNTSQPVSYTHLTLPTKA